MENKKRAVQASEVGMGTRVVWVESKFLGRT